MLRNRVKNAYLPTVLPMLVKNVLAVKREMDFKSLFLTVERKVAVHVIVLECKVPVFVLVLVLHILVMVQLTSLLQHRIAVLGIYFNACWP